MARQQTTQITSRPDNSPAFRPISDPEQLQAPVHMVDQYVAPEHNDALIGLAQGLKDFQPGVNKYLGMMQDRQNEADYLKGQQARMEQTDGNDPRLNTEQTYAFQRGYMTMHGQVMGQDAANKLLQYHEENKNTPGYDPQAAVQKFKANDIQGMTDQDSLKGYLQSMSHTENAIRKDFVQAQTEQVRQQRWEMVGSLAKQGIESASSPQEQAANYQQLQAQAASLNFTKPEVAKLYAQSLTEQALAKGPDVLRGAYIKDANGIALADNPEIAAHLEQVKIHAENLQKKRIADASEPFRQKLLMGIEKQLALDPLSLGDPMEHVANNPDLYPTVESGVSYIHRWYAAMGAKNGGIMQQDVTNLVNSPLVQAHARDPVLGKAVRDQIQQGYSKDLNSIDWQDPNSVKAGLGHMQSEFIRTNQVPDGLKGMADGLGTISLDKDGKMPAQGQVVLQVYKNLDEARSPMVHELFNDQSKIIAATYWAAIKGQAPAAEAWRQAVAMTSENAKQRLEILADHPALKKLDSSIGSEFKSWFNARVGAENLQVEGRNIFRRYVAGGASPDIAQELAVKELNNRFVMVDQGHKGLRNQQIVVEIPSADKLGMSKDAFADGLSRYLEKKSEDAGIHAPEHYYQAAMGKDGKDYIIQDASGYIINRVPVSEIRDTWADANWKSPAKITEGQTLSQMLQQHPAGPAPTTDEVIANGPHVRDAFNKGKLDAREYGRFIAMEQVAKRKAMAEEERSMIERFRSGQTDATINLSRANMGQSTIPQHLGAQVDGPKQVQDMRSQDYAAKQPDPTKSLIMHNEGIATKLYNDPASGAGKNIGYGYNLGSRSEEQVRKDFKRAGITNADEVLAGRGAITPEQAERLLDVTLPDYKLKAETAVGTETWKKLSEAQRAVLTDTAYATGDVSQFTKVLYALQNGDSKGAADALSITYVDRKTNKRMKDERRISAQRSMLNGAATWQAHLNESIQATPK